MADTEKRLAYQRFSTTTPGGSRTHSLRIRSPLANSSKALSDNELYESNPGPVPPAVPCGPEIGAQAVPQVVSEQPGPATTPAAAQAGLADVLRILDRLPLSDAEKAEVVRRLLADR